MKKESINKVLKIFISEQDKYHHDTLYEVIAMEAKNMKVAGMSVYKGIFGFGIKSHIHTSKIVRLSEDLPIIIEIIDTEGPGGRQHQAGFSRQ